MPADSRCPVSRVKLRDNIYQELCFSHTCGSHNVSYSGTNGYLTNNKKIKQTATWQMKADSTKYPTCLVTAAPSSSSSSSLLLESLTSPLRLLPAGIIRPRPRPRPLNPPRAAPPPLPRPVPASCSFFFFFFGDLSLLYFAVGERS